MDSSWVSLPGRRWRARWVGAVLSATMVVLLSAALVGTWRQDSLLRSSTQAAQGTNSFRLAVSLTANEFYLMQAMVADPLGEERGALRASQQRVTSAFEDLAARQRSSEESAEILAILDDVRYVQATAGLILSYLEQDQPERAAATLEGLEPLMRRVMDELRTEQAVHERANARIEGDAVDQSRLLVLGMVTLFVVGLGVLGVTGWLSRADRRVIERMAAEDTLTGLPNRTAFYAHAAAAFRPTGPDRPPVTVLMLDLDGFKNVNDSLGHNVGDLLLVEVAQRLRGCVRAQDVVARLGGDEFAFLLVDAQPQAGEDTAARITAALSRPFVIDHATLDVEASIGITTAAPGQDVTAAMRDADVAMYVAKEHQLVYTRYEPGQASGTLDRATVLSSVRRALDNHEIKVHFQPKVSVDTGQLIGAEALARWHHPSRGTLPPADFIPMLERTSLIHRFTADILTQALDQMRLWRGHIGWVPVSVNVSARCLLDPEFPETVAQCLLTAGVPGRLLCIEITESTVATDAERTVDTLRRIRALGVKTSIDDYGTGYSAMNYLKILPVDELKVDRSFLHDMTLGDRHSVLIESAIELGHNLGLTVVAEGVEDQPTLTALRELGCDLAQGYHFAPPLDPTAFLNWAITHSPRTAPTTQPHTSRPLPSPGSAADPASTRA